MTKLSTRHWFASACLSLTIVAIVVFVSATRPAEDTMQRERAFSYQVIDEFSVTPLSTRIWKVRVFMLPEHYSKDNLDRLFRFYSIKYPNRQDMLHIFVYTDMNNLEREKENPDGLIHVFVEPPSNSNQASPDQSERKVFYDAAFWREGPGGSVGHLNEWYRYAVDLARPEDRKAVVIRGKNPNAKEILLDSWETTWDGPKLRASAYNLEDIDPPGTYYTFECLNEASLVGGTVIMTLRSDAPVAIPREQIRMLNREITYLFMGWMYAVTTDRGNTWSVWDAQDNLQSWQCCDYGLIRDVQLIKDGTGTMLLNKAKTGDVSQRELQTTNYGRTWR